VELPGYYVRKLPHWQPDGAPLFITWRLYGSLPACSGNYRLSIPSGRDFVRWDRELDACGHGPVWLEDPRIASMVVASLHCARHELHLCELRAWVVMPNHVHVLLLPGGQLWRITKAIKGFTAREANRILGRTGHPFWQHESFDRWVRNRQEFERTVGYIEANPVRAGLVSRPEDWPWSSAASGT
jgi:putative DNA methylase